MTMLRRNLEKQSLRALIWRTLSAEFTLIVLIPVVILIIPKAGVFGIIGDTAIGIVVLLVSAAGFVFSMIQLFEKLRQLGL